MRSREVEAQRFTIVESPVGPLLLVGQDDGEGLVLTGLYLAGPSGELPLESAGARDDELFGPLAAQLREYFAGRRTDFDVRVRPDGTPFQQQVWAALQTIPYGRTASYGQIAAQIGRPSASRAVGLANGRNPISIVIPCHRVIGSTGRLVGYGGGLDRKQRLLALEAGRDSLLEQ